MKKKCYILAGPNGAGKTTFANEFLPIEAECLTTNPFFHGMLERFLDDDGSLSKGPYVSLQLPFQKGKSREFFPHVPLGFTPYRHQEQAFARLSGPAPKPTLIASFGTPSPFLMV